MQKNSFDPKLTRYVKTLEISMTETVTVQIVIEKHYQTSYGKEHDNIFQFTALFRNMEVISKIALENMQKLDPAVELNDNDLMVYSQENNYYLDEELFPHYVTQDGVFKTLDQVEQAVKFWAKTIALAVEPEPSN